MALKLVQQPQWIQGEFTQTVADSVDGLAYAPDAGGNLVVAIATSTFAVYLVKRAKVNDKVSGIVTGLVIAKASGAIAVNGPAAYDAAGKIKAGTVGTDTIIGYVWPIAAVNDGDIVSLVKTA
jgi:hypothetical protein